MFCRNCGSRINDDVKFCPNCGTPPIPPVNMQPNVVNNGQQQYGYGQQQYINMQQQYNYGYQPNNINVKSYNLISAYKEMFKKYADFNGRSTRSEYWFAFLANYIIMFVSYIIFIVSSAIYYESNSTVSLITMSVTAIAIALYALIVLVPSLALGVRRLHDTGKSGWYMFLSFIPFGGIILIVFYATDSQLGPNQYGPNPKGIVDYYPNPYNQ